MLVKAGEAMGADWKIQGGSMMMMRLVMLLMMKRHIIIQRPSKETSCVPLRGFCGRGGCNSAVKIKTLRLMMRMMMLVQGCTTQTTL